MTVSIALALLGLLATLSAISRHFARQAGRAQERLKHVEQEKKAAEQENSRMANRPRTGADRLERLLRWREHVRRHKNDAQ